MSVMLTSGSPYFYPRPPRGGRPPAFISRPFTSRISIHALREEGDGRGPAEPCRPGYFYPRPPRGGRLDVPVVFHRIGRISIHALREEGDSSSPGT